MYDVLKARYLVEVEAPLFAHIQLSTLSSIETATNVGNSESLLQQCVLENRQNFRQQRDRYHNCITQTPVSSALPWSVLSYPVWKQGLGPGMAAQIQFIIGSVGVK